MTRLLPPLRTMPVVAARLSRWRAGVLIVSLASTGVLLAGVDQLLAQTIAGFNSNQPVDYAADRIELQDRDNRVVLSGDVVVSQGDLRLTAARTIVNYTDAGTLRIQRITATGGVEVSRGSETARGAVGVYDFDRRIITLVGDVALRRGSDTLNGGRLVIDLASGVSSVDGSSAATSAVTPGASSTSGRVTGSFAVPQR
ncbi:LptA/OstA family protein [Croceicoccus sp. F390]|uniref:LptA/OstA family protein n=1 Tax=Croceicoccus esteveae TaxID=3075597 RepID=A0ABU2ZJZ2_9SPHN|nr:LptA/OstA family protein [Croceicoccus sp. F390]MDT0575717.1 LptA/OstA family protein [Croceicoccus sp. F390]